ncbi:hypothetical protein O6H91_02G095800 [Diphasiastrum complanatum]|uniref:Uncharacterized protein n=1 Tax=Diphasiastrum complanatum TaxID=34168 RepID=A0ACC2EIG1_DIPCM|nr:hypothetical protein O6H91_02G095800 [Diphasiastrum complanatum]
MAIETGGVSPEVKASLLSVISWSWLNRLMLLGKRRPIQAEDLYDLHHTESAESCEQRWTKAMEELKLNYGINQTPPVFYVLLRVLGREYFKAAIFKPIWLGAVISQVYIMKELVILAQDLNQQVLWWWGSLLVIGMCVGSVVQSIAQHLLVMLSQKIAIRLRATVSMAVFGKMTSMRLSSLENTNSGQMLNLITNDTQKMVDACNLFHFVWFGVIELLVISGLVMREAGISATAGALVIFLTQPLQMAMANAVGRWRRKAVQATDARIRLMGEILVGVRVVKYYGWTVAFINKISELRAVEMHWIKRACYMMASTSAIKDGLIPLASLATFGTYVSLHGKMLPPSSAFTVLALFGILVRVFPLASTGVQFAGEAWVAIRRLQRFLELPNGSAFRTKEEMAKMSESKSHDRPIHLSNCAFSWKLQDELEQKVQFKWTFRRSFKGSFRESLRKSFRESFLITNLSLRNLFSDSKRDMRAPDTESDKSRLICRESFDKKSAQINSQQDLNKNPVSDLNSENKKGSELSRGSELSQIDFYVNSGELVGVKGPTGSGKSSLLFALLGEMECVDGKLSFCAMQVAYVPQQPWIFNDSIRNNIIFGNPYEKQRYREVVAACALSHDIAQMEDGHETELGERGVNLSGGQKARIGLARACYSRAPLVLMDDPLAAVDVSTAKHLMEHVFGGLLKGRAVILISHRIHFLEKCDRLYLMANGTCKEIQKTGTDLADYCFNQPTEERRQNSEQESEAANLSTIPKIEVQGSDERAVHATQVPEISTSVISDDKADDALQLEERLQFLKRPSNGPDYDSLKKSNKNPRPQLVRALTTNEDRVLGNVKFSSHAQYLKAGGGLIVFTFVMIVFLVAQAIRIMTDYWLSIWTDRRYNASTALYIGVYAGFAMGSITMLLARAMLFTHFAVTAAKRLHNSMTEKVLRSPQSFFSQNLIGRILNRFSKDQAMVDELLPNSAQQSLEVLVGIVGSIASIFVVMPWILLILPPFVIFFYYIIHSYLVVSRELKRLDGISRSPIFSHFEQTLDGIATIRAYGVQPTMHARFAELIDANDRAYILFVHTSRWMAVRLDFAAAICVTASAMMVILLRTNLAPGLTGVLLVQSLHLLGTLAYGARVAADTENYFTSVERIQAYADLPTEETSLSCPSTIPENWPSQGEIEFQKYTMAYQKDLRPVLNNLTFKIQPAERIAIVGRTGAGKSTLVAAIFRMAENQNCSGSILIDGIDIQDIALDYLRQRLSIVPQDPMLFQGTVRFNLDPFESHTDEEIWEAIQTAHLEEKVHSIYMPVTENGNNFSVGQRQLLCLARCVLRRSKVIVMDEATAALDFQTDQKVKSTVSTAFRDCTVLTVAHRIETIIDYDRVLALGPGGCISEFDSPINLLRAADKSKKGGIFATMVDQCGQLVALQLREAAEAAEVARQQPPSQPIKGAEMNV